LIDPAGGKDLAERQVATVFFSDIKGFSGLGELLTATTLVELLNTYFSEMTTLIHARNGIIDKFVGDGLTAFWTAPFSRGDSHASDACLAALAQQHAVEKLRKHLSDVLGLCRDLPDFSVRMGLATGDLVVEFPHSAPLLLRCGVFGTWDIGEQRLKNIALASPGT
jgi:adenylate cyclase